MNLLDYQTSSPPYLASLLSDYKSVMSSIISEASTGSNCTKAEDFRKSVPSYSCRNF